MQQQKYLVQDDAQHAAINAKMAEVSKALADADRTAKEAALATLEAEVTRTAAVRSRRVEELLASLVMVDLLDAKVTVAGLAGTTLLFNEAEVTSQRDHWVRELRALEIGDRAVRERAAKLKQHRAAHHHRRSRSFTSVLTAHDDVIVIRGEDNTRVESWVEWMEPGETIASTLVLKPIISCIPRRTWDGGLGAAVTARYAIERMNRSGAQLTDAELMERQLQRKLDLETWIVLDGDARWDLEAIGTRLYPEARGPATIMPLGYEIPNPNAGRIHADVFRPLLRLVCPNLLYRWWERAPARRDVIEARMVELDKAEGVDANDRGAYLRRRATAWWTKQEANEVAPPDDGDDAQPGAA